MRTYDPDFKVDAVKLAQDMGVIKASRARRHYPNHTIHDIINPWRL